MMREKKERKHESVVKKIAELTLEILDMVFSIKEVLLLVVVGLLVFKDLLRGKKEVATNSPAVYSDTYGQVPTPGFSRQLYILLIVVLVLLAIQTVLVGLLIVKKL